MKPIVSVLLFWLAVAAPAAAESLTVVTEEMPPFNYSENGKVTGMATEVVRATLERADLPGEFQVLPWKRAYQTALDRPDVLIYSIGRNPEREDKFQWVGVIAPVNLYFFKLRRRDDIALGAVADARQYKIGAVSGDYTADFLRSRGFEPDVNLDVTGSFTLNLRKLFGGRIDLVLVDELTIAALLREEAASGRPYRMADLDKALFVEELSTGMYMAFSRGTSEATVAAAREALAAIKADGAYDAILERYRSGG